MTTLGDAKLTSLKDKIEKQNTKPIIERVEEVLENKEEDKKDEQEEIKDKESEEDGQEGKGEEVSEVENKIVKKIKGRSKHNKTA